jgi:hypothetical protein
MTRIPQNRVRPLNPRGTAVISFLWNTYGPKGENQQPAGIVASEACAERCIRRAFEADAATTGATIWEVKLTVSPDGQLFEWRLIRSGLIFARDDAQAVITL